MSARLAAASPRTLAALAAGVVLVYAAALWLLVVAPERSEAARAEEDLVAAELRLAEARAAANRPAGVGVRVSDVLRLARVMPPSADHAGLVLELSRVGERAGVALRSITPQAPAVGAGGATLVPVEVRVTGAFRDVVRFLRQVRRLVAVRDGRLHAKGRLLVVQRVELGESVDQRFPVVDATVVLHAYVYDGPISPQGDDEPEPDELLPTGTAAAGRSG